MKDYYVYMVLCADASYYVGVTNDVDRRVAQHNLGLDIHCYTFLRRPVRIIYAARFSDPNDAIRWEKQIKGWSRKKKAALAAGEFTRLPELARGPRDGKDA